ncbi:MAG: exodeoxyribonuclease V subunit alpha [Deltaproteobacteria bacterium]|nr:exodeoxyribonuclease V subunit alpha [Deltaproteobacteria bacterium]
MITDLAQHYFDFLRRLAPKAGAPVWLAGALAVQASMEGNTCLDLREIGGQNIQDITPNTGDGAAGIFAGRIRLPAAETLKDELLRSGTAGKPGSMRPFILDDFSLYLRRYWQYEKSLALELQRRCFTWPKPDFKQISAYLDRLFSPPENGEPDWQRVAAAVCALKGLCVISGGPGTGKTFTVARIIALLQMISAPASLRIALTAPTGKAAERLAEAIGEAVHVLELPADIIAVMPREAATIHRLLGTRGNSPYFRHNRDNKLAVDVLIVDEVSMVDLALMAKLMAAVPIDARVILLGDREQLASVESGRVMADICGDTGGNCFSSDFAAKLRQAGCGSPGLTAAARAGKGGTIDDSVVLLARNYRFGEASGIAALAAAIIAGETERAIDCFNKYQELGKIANGRIDRQQGRAAAQLQHRIIQEYGPLFSCREPVAAFEVFSQFQILCVLRRDEMGVRQINQWVTAIMRQEGLIHGTDKWYQGRPIMITNNNYGLGLFNGDIGITMTNTSGRLQVFFQQDNKFRPIACARIPAHETAFASTVHKSQGSEFKRVLLMLPVRQSPILSRELLYTAVTRAREHFELWGDKEIFKQGIDNRVGRSTGLDTRLRPKSSPL